MVKHQIDTGSHPSISRPPYRQSPARRKLTQELVKELLDLSIVRPSSSPWASPVVIVQKKTGDLRFCVDYRKLDLLIKLASSRFRCSSKVEEYTRMSSR